MESGDAEGEGRRKRGGKRGSAASEVTTFTSELRAATPTTPTTKGIDEPIPSYGAGEISFRVPASELSTPGASHLPPLSIHADTSPLVTGHGLEIDVQCKTEVVGAREVEEEEIEGDELDFKHAKGKEKGDEGMSTRGSAGEGLGKLDSIDGSMKKRGRRKRRGSASEGEFVRLGTVNCHTKVEINREQLLFTLSEVAMVDICAVTETWLKEEDRQAIEFMSEKSDYFWVGRERIDRKGGGEGFFIRNSVRWKKDNTGKTQAFWISVEGIGAVGVVYFPPAEKKSDFKARVDALVAECRARKEEGQVIVTGDFNARVGELSNRYRVDGKEVVEDRVSKDKVINYRGRYLMKTMNDGEMILLNGREGDGADYTYYHTNGDSTIDFIWVMQSSTRDLGCCEMWFDATCAYSDHALVTTDLRAALTQRVLKTSHRASHWKRKATESWMKDASGVWAQWNETFLTGVIQDAWGKWKQEATTTEERDTMLEGQARSYGSWSRKGTICAGKEWTLENSKGRSVKSRCGWTE